ncbi:hypothetical protein BJ138DRAFT_1104490 [Hygrophoropsis aurantiaca]|uniref:Uncharacterized protein n=1 Tax=Hygrophoropsis aurantiaca TaxID=72124 RepID=A0ACB8A1X0_9AGAM|nr:hypothetical protein BJ138DRAFT_1104490 [Hygrophoropsis aurantiaca]
MCRSEAGAYSTDPKRAQKVPNRIGRMKPGTHAQVNRLGRGGRKEVLVNGHGRCSVCTDKPKAPVDVGNTGVLIYWQGCGRGRSRYPRLKARCMEGDVNGVVVVAVLGNSSSKDGIIFASSFVTNPSSNPLIPLQLTARYRSHQHLAIAITSTIRLPFGSGGAYMTKRARVYERTEGKGDGSPVPFWDRGYGTHIHHETKHDGGTPNTELQYKLVHIGLTSFPLAAVNALRHYDEITLRHSEFKVGRLLTFIAANFQISGLEPGAIAMQNLPASRSLYTPANSLLNSRYPITGTGTPIEDDTRIFGHGLRGGLRFHEVDESKRDSVVADVFSLSLHDAGTDPRHSPLLVPSLRRYLRVHRHHQLRIWPYRQAVGSEKDKLETMIQKTARDKYLEANFPLIGSLFWVSFSLEEKPWNLGVLPLFLGARPHSEFLAHFESATLM